MTLFHRIGRFTRPGALLCSVLLLAGLPVKVLQAQANSTAPPSAWDTDDDRDPAAMDWSDEVPAHLAVVEGAAWLVRDGAEGAAAENAPLLAGDRVRTAHGRIEIAFDDGSALDVDEGTSLDLLSDLLIRLQTGRVRLTLARGATSADYRIDAAGTTIALRAGGEYGVIAEGLSSADPGVTVSVTRGSAEVVSPYGQTVLHPGYEASASARTEPSPPRAVSLAASDTFALWADGLASARAGVVSARYLPPEVRSYSGLFDQYGNWQFDTSLGYVWYPHVDSAWRPYYTGLWSYVGPYGWFWIGADRWSWPTHHYGRWGFAGARWYWIPDRHWGPAWVSWAASAQYVSWAPLGYNNRPVVSLTFAFGYSSSPWRAWTAVPMNRFGRTAIVNAHTRTVAVPVNTRFVERRSAPLRPASARVDARPIRSPGSPGSNGYSAATHQPVRNSPAPAIGRSNLADDRRLSTRAISPTRTPAPLGAPSPATVTGGASDRWDRAAPSMPRAERSYSSTARSPSAPQAVGRDSRSRPSIGSALSSQPPSAPNRAVMDHATERPVRPAMPPSYGAPAPARTQHPSDNGSPRALSSERTAPVDRRVPTSSSEPWARPAAPPQRPDAARAPAPSPPPAPAHGAPPPTGSRQRR